MTGNDSVPIVAGHILFRINWMEMGQVAVLIVSEQCG